MSHCESCKRTYFKDEYGGIREDRACCTTDTLVTCKGCGHEAELAALRQVAEAAQPFAFGPLWGTMLAQMPVEVAAMLVKLRRPLQDALAALEKVQP